jgi:hypothetical protein
LKTPGKQGKFWKGKKPGNQKQEKKAVVALD